jgi:hypothetical protein
MKKFKINRHRLIFFLGLTVFYFNMNAQNAGNALNFDGTDDEVTTIGYQGITGSASRTVELWVKTTSTTKTLVSWGDTGNGERWDFNIDASGRLRVIVQGGNVIGTNAINDNEYHHIAVVLEDDGSTNINEAIFYVDGEIEPISSSASEPVNSATTFDMHIGNYFDPGFPRYINGNIDELRVWSTARTLEQLRENMHKDLTPGSEANLDAYYKFDETSGATTIVDSKNSNNGTWTGSGGSNFVASNAVIGDATAQMQTDIRAVWEASGTNNSLESDGVTIGVGTTLSETNFAVFGHNNAGVGTTTNDLGASAATNRFDQIWYVGEEGTVGGATLTFDLGTISGTPVTAGTASDYVLLFRAGTSGDFSDVATGSSTANGDQILFTSIALEDGYYTIGTSNNSNSPLLPVDLLSFEAHEFKETVQLNWRTASEINNDFFTVERSKDGREFVTVTQVSGMGTTYEQQTYQAVDKNPHNGINYYRLKQTDYDGEFQYSDIVSMNFKTKYDNLIQIFPNPVQHGEITLSIPDLELETANLELINASGIRVLSQSIIDSNTTLDIQLLPAGLYWLNVNIDGKIIQEKVMID